MFWLKINLSVFVQMMTFLVNHSVFAQTNIIDRKRGGVGGKIRLGYIIIEIHKRETCIKKQITIKVKYYICQSHRIELSGVGTRSRTTVVTVVTEMFFSVFICPVCTVSIGEKPNRRFTGSV